MDTEGRSQDFRTIGTSDTNAILCLQQNSGQALSEDMEEKKVEAGSAKRKPGKLVQRLVPSSVPPIVPSSKKEPIVKRRAKGSPMPPIPEGKQ
jgi:hypothetical protein